MATCEKELRNFLPNLQPSKSQIEGAKRSHNRLREILNTGQFQNRIIRSYLSGSYARETAVFPLDDVDIIFAINQDAWKTNFLQEYPDPQTLLKSFHRAIKYRYQTSRVRLQRRSVGLKLSHIDIDIVPAIELDSAGNYILIPDRVDETWIKSGPKVHSTIAININKRQMGLFKPIVKLLKFWNSRLPATARLKSFAIETIAARLFANSKIDSLEVGLAVAFDFIASLDGKEQIYHWPDSYGITTNAFTGTMKVPDLADTGSNVTAGVDRQRLARFFVHAERSLNKIIDADYATREQVAWRRMQEALRI